MAGNPVRIFPIRVLQALGGLLQLFFHGYLPISHAGARSFRGVDFGKYHLYQGKTPHCADTSVAMLCRMMDETAGGRAVREAGTVTDYLDSLAFGRDAAGGTTLWGLNKALNHFDIPYVFHFFGRVSRIDHALSRGKVVLISKGRIAVRRWPPGIDPHGTQGHVFIVVGSQGEDFELLDPAAGPGSGVTRIGKTELLGQWWHPPFHPMWVIG
jgi:hypothetical protein